MLKIIDFQSKKIFKFFYTSKIFKKITENPQDFQSLKMLEAFLNYL